MARNLECARLKGLVRYGPATPKRFGCRKPRRCDGVKIVDVTEFYSERGGGIRSHLTVRGHFLCQLGHEYVVMAPGPRDEDAPAEQDVAPSRPPPRLVR